MKKNVKRLLSLLLAMAMCLSLLSANVWAVELEPQVEDGSVSVQSSEETAAEEEKSVEENDLSEEESSGEELAALGEEMCTEESAIQEEGADTDTQSEGDKSSAEEESTAEAPVEENAQTKEENLNVEQSDEKQRKLETQADNEYAWFPAPAMNLTQLAYETYSHGSCNAIDMAPGGRVFAPFTGTIKQVDARWGYVLFQSNSKVHFADGSYDYMTVGFMHDSDISDLWVGKVVNQGTGFYDAGGMGSGNPNAYGAHVDMSVFRGQVNSVTSYGRGNTFAYDALYINPAKTTSIINKGKAEQSVNNGAPSNWSNLWRTLNSNPTPTISGANSPGTLTVGSVFSIKGTVSCGQTLTNVTAGVYDADGNMKTGKSASPNSTSYNIVGLDNEVYFNHLTPGVYRYQVSATAAGQTTVLLKKDFIVLAKSDTVSSGTYMLESCGNSDLTVGVDDNSNVYLSHKASRDSQLFEVTSLGNGYYHLKNVETGKMLDVSNADSAAGVNVQLWAANDSTAQNWQILPVMDGYALVPQCGTSNCLDVYGAAYNNGTNIQVYTAHIENKSERFKLKTVTKSSVGGKGNKIAFDLQGGSVSGAVKTYTVNGVNHNRVAKALIIYSMEGLMPYTNQYGREAAVDSSGKVTSIREYGSEAQLTVPSGGFVISGHSDYGEGGVQFVNELSVGSYIGYNSGTKTASAYKDRNSYLIENKYVENGGTYGDLPAPHKNGYTFTGWYTSASGGIRIRKTSTYSVNELYAHWEKEGAETPAASQTYQGHRYEMYDYLMTWEEAKAFCEAKGGHLATISSAQENESAAKLLTSGETGWIGATDQDNEGTFSWVTGETVSYTNWEQGEPNDYGGNEDYAELLSSGVWNDNSGTALRPFICEYDSDNVKTNISTCTVTLSQTSYTYDGTAKQPTVTVKDGDKTLTRGTDYEVAYRNNVEPGTATVTVTGKGNYTGNVEKNFSIKKDDVPSNADAVFTVGSVSSAPGKQITVPVSITKNPGIAGFALDVGYDHSLLTLKNATAVSSLGGTFTRNNDTVTWFSDSNVSTTGKVFELAFDVSANAGDTQTDVSLSMRDGKSNVTDENSTNVSTDFVKGTVSIRNGVRGDVTGDGDVTIADVVKVNRHVAGKITMTAAEQQAADVTDDGDVTIADVVKLNRYVAGKITTLAVSSTLSTQSSSDATITVGSVSAKTGQKVSIPVKISGNPGIAGMALEFSLPSGMTLNSITAGDVLKDGRFTQNGKIITWYATDNTFRDGVILNLNVTAPTSAGSYTVKAALKDGKASNFSDEASNSVGVSFEAGKVSVTGNSLSKTILSSVKWDKKKKTVTVKWKKNTKGKGYEVEYSTDNKFKKSEKVVKIKNNKTVTTTVKKLKKGTWYFRIRTVKGKEYSDWSGVKKVIVK